MNHRDEFNFLLPRWIHESLKLQPTATGETPNVPPSAWSWVCWVYGFVEPEERTVSHGSRLWRAFLLPWAAVFIAEKRMELSSPGCARAGLHMVSVSFHACLLDSYYMYVLGAVTVLAGWWGRGTDK